MWPSSEKVADVLLVACCRGIHTREDVPYPVSHELSGELRQ